jgi:hypothetical protein
MAIHSIDTMVIGPKIVVETQVPTVISSLSSSVSLPTLIPVTTPSHSNADLSPPPPSPSSLSPQSISTVITNPSQLASQSSLSNDSLADLKIAGGQPFTNCTSHKTHESSEITSAHPSHTSARTSVSLPTTLVISPSTQPNPTQPISDTTDHHPLQSLDCFSTPVYPTATACPANLEIAAIGSLTVEHDDSNSTDSQLAPEYSQATLDYYKEIQEYLQQANADETEIKKKKKKANPTLTPDNPILFYV